MHNETPKNPVSDTDCVRFLQWALPRLGMRWKGFRKVRGQVRKRLRSRLIELQLHDLAAYQRYLEQHSSEWQALDAMCRITISRFYRDRAVFHQLEHVVLPALAAEKRKQHQKRIRIWSAGCASGEEPYSLRLAWDRILAPAFPDIAVDIVATDVDEHLLERAKTACYTHGAIRRLPAEWLKGCFIEHDSQFCLTDTVKAGVEFVQHDIRGPFGRGPFDLILCRNLAFTYYARALKQAVLHNLDECLVQGGYLIIGVHETLNDAPSGFVADDAKLGIYKKRTSG